MYKIDKLNSISNLIYNYLNKENFSVIENCQEPIAALVRSADMHDYQYDSNLIAVARAGAGVNNIPLEKMANDGVVVFNTPGANANAVKELVIAAMLISNRDIIGGYNWTQTLADQEDAAKQVESGKKAFVGPELLGKTLGLIGLGAIGGLVANCAISLGMKVIGYDPFLTENAKKSLDNTVVITNNLNDIYTESDYISIHVPLNDKTKDTINSDTIALMKNGVRIINCARGELVNSEAIIAALESGKVAKYVTDFPNVSVIGKNKNIITIPHLGASTPEAEDNCALMAAKQLKDYIVDGNIVNAVTYPSLTLERTGKIRTCVLTKGKTDFASILDVLSPLSITGSVFKTKGDFGYAIIDTEMQPTDKIIVKIDYLKIRII